jgi:hypothetical protein
MEQPPKWFRPVAIAALLWNLIGCAAYLSDVMLTPADLAKMTEAQQALYHARPAWSVAATAIAVWGGAAGCLALILRRSWATPLLIASLAGLIVQDLSLFVLTTAPTQRNAVALVLQGLVLLIGLGLVRLARTATARGWIRT